MILNWKKDRKYKNAEEGWDDDGNLIGSVSYADYCDPPYQATKNDIRRAFDGEHSAKAWVEREGLDNVAHILMFPAEGTISLREGPHGSKPPTAELGRDKHASQYQKAPPEPTWRSLLRPSGRRIR